MMRRVAVAFLLCTTACSSLRPVAQPTRYIAEKNPLIVHVSYVAEGVGRAMDLANPKVVGDSLMGMRMSRAGSHPIAVPVRDIHSVRARRFDGGRTAMLAAGITILAAFGVYAIVGTSNGRDNWYCDYNDSVRGPNGEPLCGPA